MQIFFLTAIILIFAVIVPGMIFSASVQHDHAVKISEAINFINNNAANNKIYAFSTTINIPYKFVDQLKVKSVSRFPSQLLLPGLIKQLAAARTVKQKNQFNRYKREIIGMVVDDLRLYQPDLIIVDSFTEKFLFPQQKFDYFKFFSQNKEFKRIITSYHYVHRIGNLLFYKRRK